MIISVFLYSSFWFSSSSPAFVSILRCLVPLSANQKIIYYPDRDHSKCWLDNHDSSYQNKTKKIEFSRIGWKKVKCLVLWKYWILCVILWSVCIVSVCGWINGWKYRRFECVDWFFFNRVCLRRGLRVNIAKSKVVGLGWGWNGGACRNPSWANGAGARV